MNNNHSLTIRQLNILIFRSQGYHQKELPPILKCSLSSVKMDSRLALAKLKANNMVHAVTIALRDKIISTNTPTDTF